MPTAAPAKKKAAKVEEEPPIGERHHAELTAHGFTPKGRSAERATGATTIHAYGSSNDGAVHVAQWHDGSASVAKHVSKAGNVLGKAGYSEMTPGEFMGAHARYHKDKSSMAIHPEALKHFAKHGFQPTGGFKLAGGAIYHHFEHPKNGSITVNHASGEFAHHHPNGDVKARGKVPGASEKAAKMHDVEVGSGLIERFSDALSVDEKTWIAAVSLGERPSLPGSISEKLVELFAARKPRDEKSAHEKAWAKRKRAKSGKEGVIDHEAEKAKYSHARMRSIAADTYATCIPHDPHAQLEAHDCHKAAAEASKRIDPSASQRHREEMEHYKKRHKATFEMSTGTHLEKVRLKTMLENEKKRASDPMKLHLKEVEGRIQKRWTDEDSAREKAASRKKPG